MGIARVPYARSLEIVTPASNAILTGGETVLMRVRARSDGQVWTGTSPRIRFEGPWTGNFVDFVDDGTSGDSVAGDGIYSKSVKLPSAVGSYTVYAVARSVEPALVRDITSTVFSVSIIPPPALDVSPESRDFGYVLVGSNATALFSIQNIGGGILTGSVAVSSPFAVISGGSYNLSSGQTQNVTVRYKPLSVGSHSNDLIFTGNSGARCPLTGIARVPYARSLEVVTPASNAILAGGASVVMQVRAWSDGQIWTGASPRIRLEGPWSGNFWDFVDDGTLGDSTAGDGLYSRTVKLPSTVGKYTVYAIARSVEPALVRDITSTVFSVSMIVAPVLSAALKSWNFGNVLQWSSESNQQYSLLSSTNLRIGLYEVVASNILATPYLNAYTDSSARIESPRFYRILVEQK